MTDSNTAFAEEIPIASLAALRAPISALNAAVLAERDSTLGCVSPTTQGWGVVIIQGGGGGGSGEKRREVERLSTGAT